MDTSNILYKNQGIHAVISLLTVSDNKFKVLLIQRNNHPFKNFWSLLGGAVYNNEDLTTAIERELFEKAGIENIKAMLHNVFSNPDRAKETGFRMLGIGYLGLVDETAIETTKTSPKAKELRWFDIEKLPKLAYDHNEILLSAIDYLKKMIFETNILKVLFPDTVTIPTLHSVYEKIMSTKLDRRNFRKKLLSTGLLIDCNTYSKEKGKKPSKLYKIVDNTNI